MQFLEPLDKNKIGKTCVNHIFLFSNRLSILSLSLNIDLQTIIDPLWSLFISRILIDFSITLRLALRTIVIDIF